jgi:protein-tyrosine phosphatase
MFFDIFKKKVKTNIDFSSIGVDMHSHLIPGIDDGAKTIEDSLNLIRGLQDLGYKKIITTPHIYKEHYPNTKEGILEGLKTLKEAMYQSGITMPIEASAEYFMDEHFEELLEKNEILPINGKYVLVEMSFYGMPPKLFQFIFKIQRLGYIPILAHPERYIYMKENIEIYHEFKSKGVLFQVNAMSPMGYYGKPIKIFAEKLLKENLIDIIGTDMHHIGHTEFIKNHYLESEFQHLISTYEFKNNEFFAA